MFNHKIKSNRGNVMNLFGFILGVNHKLKEKIISLKDYYTREILSKMDVNMSRICFFYFQNKFFELLYWSNDCKDQVIGISNGKEVENDNLSNKRKLEPPFHNINNQNIIK